MAHHQPFRAFNGPAETPASPRTMRALRKIRSHQVLTSSSALIAQTQASNASETSEDRSVGTPGSTASRNPTHRRARSNSDAATRASALAAPVPAPAHRRPARKTGSGIGVKRSQLETLLRDGPQNGKGFDSLEELKYLVLSCRVDADSDGMSPYRIYLWLVLLNIPPVPTDDYLALIHRGRSPAYAKIRNDTFRTLATDPLFKRRVTEASLIRLLNAVAWRLHDSKVKPKPRSRPSSSRRLEMELLINTPPRIEEEPEEDSPNPKLVESATYVQGMNVLCAPFLYAARSEVEAFALFHYFITQECPGYIRGAMDGVHKGLRLVDRCLEVLEPKLAAHLFSKGMNAELYAFPSVLTFCACTPPLPEVLHLWDFLFAYGTHLNIVCIVAQLLRMKDALLESDNPNKILRNLPALDAEKIIALTVLLAPKIPADLYADMISHAK